MVGGPSTEAEAAGEGRCSDAAYPIETVATWSGIVSVYQMLGNLNLCVKCLPNMHSSDVFPAKEIVLSSSESTN